MTDSVRLGRLAGIPFGVHWSLLVFAGVAVWNLTLGFFPYVAPDASAVANLAAALIGVAGLFVSILAHELAHVRRHDWLVTFAQTVIEALLFYHPAMWWISNQIRKERENCCDDIAVAVSKDRTSYVQALARLEQGRSVATVSVLGATGGSLLDRVRRLLGEPNREFGSAAVPSDEAHERVVVFLCGVVVRGDGHALGGEPVG